MRLIFRLAPAFVLVLGLVLASGKASAQDHEVEIRDFAFEPATLTVQVGDTVTWINYDTMPHNAAATDGTFQTEVVTGSADGVVSGSYTFTADDVGTHEYICNVHPDMEGTIVVEAADDQDTQDDDQDDQQGDDQQDGQMPDEMPDNGAGGMAPPTFPIGNGLAGATVLLAAAYAGFRRR